jgi:hypothetical protein
VFPRFIEESGFETAPSSLSLWADIESLMAFSYSGVHADALKHGRTWQLPRRWPALVLWWTDDRPDWRDAVSRFERLHDHGAGPDAFHFKEPYGPDGDRMIPDRARIRRLSEANAERHADLLAAVLGLQV